MNCKCATVNANDTEALQHVTSELMHKRSGVLAVRIPHFLDADEIDGILTNVRSITQECVRSPTINNELFSYGQPQQVSRQTPRSYHLDADTWRQNTSYMRAAGPESLVVQKTIATLTSGFAKKMLPAKQNGRDLLPAVVRCLDFAVPHTDVVSTHSSRWEIGALENDIAWNNYLQMPASGGELIIYEERTKNDLGERNWSKFPKIVIQPEKGDLIFFRTGAPHEIRRSDIPGSRLSVHGILGFERGHSEIGRYWA